MNRKKTLYYKIARYLCEKYDEVENTKYVAYFFEMITFQIIETIIILYVSSRLNVFDYTLIAMFGFLIPRVTKNGYHADSTFKCMVYSLVLFVCIGLVGSLLGLIPSFLMGVLFGIVLRKRK
jgi:accessory gene regulator protein AgrB